MSWGPGIPLSERWKPAAAWFWPWLPGGTRRRSQLRFAGALQVLGYKNPNFHSLPLGCYASSGHLTFYPRSPDAGYFAINAILLVTPGSH